MPFPVMSKALFYFLFLSIFCSICNGQIIKSFAGKAGPQGYTGDGGPATSARLKYPISIASDNAGSLYIADYGNHVIRKVNTAGIISTFAGSGSYGYSGDGGPASEARLNYPCAVACDNDGNVYIADSYNNVVRKVDAGGIIKTIAGTGKQGYSGDGGPAISAKLDLSGWGYFAFDKQNNMYLSDMHNHTIRKVSTAGIISTIAGNRTESYTGDGGPAKDAGLGSPSALAFDRAGNLYMSDYTFMVVRKIDTTGIISTFAGTGKYGYSGDGGLASKAQFAAASPSGLAIDNCDNLYLTDYQNFVVRKINTTGIISTIAGDGKNATGGNGGPPLLAQIYFPTRICVDAFDNIYILDTYNNEVRKITPAVAPVEQQPQSATVCSGGNAKFIVKSVRATGFKWQVNKGNGWNDLSDDAIYSGTATSSLTITGATVSMNNYHYRCAVAAPCAEIFTWTATLTVAVYAAPSLTIAASHLSICKGTKVSFTADAVNSGTSPIFQWKKNGLNTGNNNNTYTDSVLNNNDVITCSLIAVGNCLINNTAVSNTLTMIVAPVLHPSVSITASLNNTCSGTPVIFTVHVDDAGNSPGYQWTKNGLNVGNTVAWYKDDSLNMGDKISCIVTPAAGCTVYTGTASNIIEMNIIQKLVPIVTITPGDITVCAGTPLTFNASVLNGGTAPLYQWKKNNTNTGSNSSSFTDEHLSNGDLINCVLSTDAACVTMNMASSNIAKVSVSPVIKPAVFITASENNICSGTPVSFTANVVNAGSSPAYQWIKNGIYVGNGLPGYTDDLLNDADTISCTITVSNSCTAWSVAMSNLVKINVHPFIAANIIIAADDSSVCAGKAVTLTASVTNGGSKPVYQWIKNGSPVGSNSEKYTDGMFVNGDIIYCSLKPDNACSNVSEIISNTVPITVFTPPLVTLDHNTSLCKGSNRLLDAGDFSLYQWSNGSTQRTLAINDTGRYSVTVTDKNGCRANDTVEVSKLLPVPANFLPVDTAACLYTPLLLKSSANFSSYLWSTQTSLSYINIIEPGLYWLQVADHIGCIGRDSVNIYPKQCVEGFYIPTAFSPNSDGKNDIFKPLIYGNIKKYRFEVYNRWGKPVFQTTATGKGWDGNIAGIKQDAGAFVWFCTYQLEGAAVHTEKGTVVLIR